MDNDNKDGDDDIDDDDADVDGPTVEAHIDLAERKCKYHTSQCCLVYLPTFTVHRVYPEDIAVEIEQPDLPNLIQQFIYKEQDSDHVSNDSSVSALPTFYGKITVYPSAPCS